MAKSPSDIINPIPGFKIIGKLGHGGMGAVYRARQLSMQRDVALKVLPRPLARQLDFKTRFFREARAAAALSHGNIVSVFDAAEAGEYCYIAMEYVDGVTVSDLIDQKFRIEEAEALEITRQTAEALRHAWSRNIIHRDVKPENILYTSEKIAKLCDLGVAKVPNPAKVIKEVYAVGTPLYISPEAAQALPDTDFRTDIYSLGATLFHMLAGIPPFDHEDPSVIMLKHVKEEPPDIRRLAPGTSRATAGLVNRMLEKSPDNRYQTAETLLEDIRRCISGAPVPTPIGDQPSPPKRPSTRFHKTGPKRNTSTRRLIAVKAKQHNQTSPVIWMLIFVALALIVAVLVFSGEIR